MTTPRDPRPIPPPPPPRRRTVLPSTERKAVTTKPYRTYDPIGNDSERRRRREARINYRDLMRPGFGR